MRHGNTVMTLPDGTTTKDADLYGNSWTRLGDGFLALLPKSLQGGRGREGWLQDGHTGDVLTFSHYGREGSSRGISGEIEPGQLYVDRRMTVPADVMLALLNRSPVWKRAELKCPRGKRRDETGVCRRKRNR